MNEIKETNGVQFAEVHPTNPKSFNEGFARRLSAHMTMVGMNQKEFSIAMKVSPQSVTDWVHGRKVPRMDKVDTMCKIFDCSRSDLLEDKKSIGEISPSEYALIEKYRSADQLEKEMVKKILGIK